jgi:hypothetical protein
VKGLDNATVRIVTLHCGAQYNFRMNLSYLERYSMQVRASVAQNTALRPTSVNKLTYLQFSFSKHGSVFPPGVHTGSYLGNYGDTISLR